MNRFNLAILISFPIAAFLLVYICTLSCNLGVTPDSIFYIEGANSLKSSLGYVTESGKLINHWPPFYSILLACFSFLVKEDVLRIGSLFNSLFCAGFFFLFALILIRRLTSRFSLFILNLFLLFSASLDVFAFFWSEGPFLFLLGAIIYLLIAVETNPSSVVGYGVVGFLCGLLFLTRYAALPFILVVSVYTKYISGENRNLRFVRLGFFFSLLAITASIWIIYTKSFNQEMTSRGMSYHLITGNHLRQFLGTMHLWIIPYVSWNRLLLILCFILMSFILSQQMYCQFVKLIRTTHRFSKMLIALILIYCLFLFVSISFFDYATPLDSRILSPLYFLLLILIAPLLDWLRMVSYKPIRFGFYILLTYFLIGNARSSFSFWSNFKRYGAGYTSVAYRHSKLVNDISKIKHGKILSNRADALKFLSPATKDSVLSLPYKYNSVDGKLNILYSAEFSKVCHAVVNRTAVIAFFYDARMYLPSEVEVKACLPDESYLRFYPDGFIAGVIY